MVVLIDAVRVQSTVSARTSILFLCTGNSARSIMAEAIANEMFGDELTAVSAGSQPKGQPHELALATLAAHGLSTDKWRSKSWEEFADRRFDLVVTLCDAASAEPCPVAPGASARAHWGFPDPPAASDPEQAFEEVFTGLMDALEVLTSPPDYDIAAKAEIVARHVRERFPQANRG